MIYFRRRQFYGPDRHDPKWHIVTTEPVEYDNVRALCGYSQRHMRDRLLISRTTHPKAAASVCAKCQAKMASAAPAP